MAKTKVSEFDAVASNNTDINNVNVSEGCPPSGINDALRSLASLLKKQEVGTDAMTSPDINGGTIDGATIGGSSGVTIGVSDGTVSAPSIKFTSDTNTGIYRGGTDILKFVTAGTDAITIDASQNVGIGISSPATTLHIGDSDTAVNGTMRFGQNSTYYGFIQKVYATDKFDIGTNGSGQHISFTNNGSEAMRIDSSQNLLVGVTSTTIPGVGNTTEGVSLRGSIGSASSIAVSRATASAGYFNINADGDILSLRRSGSQIGGIGVEGGDSLYIVNGDTGLRFSGGGDIIIPVSTSGASRDNAITLGSSGARFQDLYLSGGAYLGGTGSANYLDDYEEGTFTPTIESTGTNPTVSYSIQEGNYTKIGNQVTVQGNITFSSYSGNGGSARLHGIPFSVVTHTNYRAVGQVAISSLGTSLTGDYTSLQLSYNSGTSMQILMNNSVTGGMAETPANNIDAGTIIRYQLTYFTA